MTPKELYIHITSQMTAEQALLKLLEGQVRTYEKLKFNEGEEIHPVFVMSMAALDMDWQIAIPNTADDDEELTGMVVGTTEYVEDIFGDEERLLEALDLLQYFVDRVEAGTIRSKTTYKKYKDFLDNINNPDNE